jgi:type I restriction enzyme R subunit
MQDRLKKGRERLDSALEALFLLCEPVQPPKSDLEHIHYFCGNTELPESLKEHEPQRIALYKSTVAFIRAYANIADELEAAGYSAADITRIKSKVDYYLRLREIIRLASGETLDLKAYEADMRHLIDTYIQANEPRKTSDFDNIGLLELIEKLGIMGAIEQGLKPLTGNREAIAETIENNVRRKIIREQLTDPAYYDKMSTLLDEIIAARKAKAIDYEEYLRRIAEIAVNAGKGHSDETPEQLNTPGKRALYNNLKKPSAPANERVAEDTPAYGDPVLTLALLIDETVHRVKPDQFRGHQAKENEIKRALLPLLGNNVAEVERIFKIISAPQNGY